MKVLTYVLIVKIVITLVCWCLPLLTFPPSWFWTLGIPSPEPLLFARMLGAAYAALLVGYAFGLEEIKKGKFPNQAVWVGIVSNGLGCSILTYNGIIGSWMAWSLRGQALMWFSIGATFCITGLLVWSRITYTRNAWK